jgi:hypothetical protein
LGHHPADDRVDLDLMRDTRAEPNRFSGRWGLPRYSWLSGIQAPTAPELPRYKVLKNSISPLSSRQGFFG